MARLDVLRAVAVLLVMGRHLSLPGPEHSRWLAVISFVRMPAWLGVDLFFVLSGFLVSGLLFREHRLRGRLDAGRFLIRRGFKIYPSYYVFLFATYVLATFPRRQPGPWQLLQYAAFVQNYVAWMPLPWGPLWSVAVEEHFYLLLAVALAWRLKPPRAMPALREVIWSWGGVMAAVLAARLLTLSLVMRNGALKSTNQENFYRTHLRIDALLFGVVLAYIYHRRPDLWRRLAARRGALAVAGALALSPSFFFSFSHTFTLTVGLTLYYLGWGAILVATLGDPDRPAVAAAWERPLARIGEYSYSIYLWHFAVLTWGVPQLARVAGGPLPYALELLAFVAGSIVVGVLMARLVELPGLAVRERIFPSRTVEAPR